MESYLSLVINSTRAFMRKHISAGPLLSLCEQRLDLFEKEVLQQGMAPCIDVPYHLCHGLSQDAEKSRTAAVLSTFIYLGCDILDDLHDNELPRDQKEYSPACASLAGSLLLSTMPVLVIGEFFDSEDARRFLACRIVGESLLKMAEGQSKDIQSRFNADLSVEEIEKG